MRVSDTGVWYPEHVHKVPGVMRLLAPGTATAVPARLVIEARGRGDELVCEFRPRALAQVIIPNDVDAGLTVLNETAGQLAVEGRIDGESFAFETETVVEFLGG